MAAKVYGIEEKKKTLKEVVPMTEFQDVIRKGNFIKIRGKISNVAAKSESYQGIRLEPYGIGVSDKNDIFPLSVVQGYSEYVVTSQVNNANYPFLQITNRNLGINVYNDSSTARDIYYNVLLFVLKD